MTQLHFRHDYDALRIDKGSQAVRCVIACSGGTIRCTVIL